VYEVFRGYFLVIYRPQQLARAVADGQAHHVAYHHGAVGGGGVHLGHGHIDADAHGHAHIGRYEDRAGAGSQF